MHGSDIAGGQDVVLAGDAAELGLGGSGPMTSRRTALRAGLALTTAATIQLAGGRITSLAEAASLPYDPQQRFLQFVGGGNGQVFAIQADGTLLWYRNTGWATAAGGWASGSGRRIGTMWHQFVTVMGSTDGSLYALRADGTLFYYRYAVTNWSTGQGTWVASRKIGSGFNKFARVFGFGGDVYGVSTSGQLYRYHYTPSSNTWAGSSGSRLSGSFSSSTLAADAGGVIYAYRFGWIYWHRQVNGAWVSGSGRQIGSGFGDLAVHGLTFAGQGSLYVVRPTAPRLSAAGQLVSYRLTNYLTAGSAGPKWANRASGANVGTGWTVEATAALQGYARTHSVVRGQTAEIAVSSTFSQFGWSVVRVGAGASPVEVKARTTATGGVQRLPVGFLTTGCGWTPKVRFTVPTSWAPGLYAVRLHGPYGARRDVPFVVKPATPTNRIAVLLPTNTYHAYNAWGGHSNYCTDLTGYRTLTLARPSRENATEATGHVEHTMWSDVLLLQWMSKQGLAHDCYTDTDLHATGSWLSKYKVLVLGSHPEYWSDRMRQNLVNFMAGGGRLIYAGGNGLYERVSFDSTLQKVTFRRSNGNRDYYTQLGRPASQILGTNYAAGSWFTFAPYRVVRNHPLLAGTGLTVGSLFGRTGYNGAASGWETDRFLGLDGEATAAQVIAEGQNSGGGAKMIYRDTPSGGFVFSASSIAFTGALASDAAMSKLLRNVFDKALALPAPKPSATAPQKTVAPAPAQPETPAIR